ncbi:cysteine--tRNA ligase [soil metagenome]
MTLRLTNTLGGGVEEFAPLEPGHVRMYTCGPTVYGPAHIGNFRSFVFADLLRRYLGWSGHRVTWVMNITDVDDRITRDLAEAGGTLEELTAPHISRFLADLAELRVSTPEVMPRATAHVPEMAALTATLLSNGHAYTADDGSVFFRISSWPSYGTLARLDPDQARRGERVADDDYGKDDARDFALWKAAKPGEPAWESEVGRGRPGWHIECSAMSMKYLGPSFDIHTGGVDLVFPHHENEIAQSEAASGQPFVRTWLHCAHLQMGGQKMARRDGNIHLPADVYASGHRSSALRYALLATHYRAPIEYGDDTLDNASAAVTRLSTAVLALEAYHEERPDDATLEDALSAARGGFEAGLDDDLNVSVALAAVFELVRELNRRLDSRGLSTADARRAAACLRDLDRVLAVIDEPVELPGDVVAMLEQRAAARQARDWPTSDRLRDDLLAAGILVEDTRDGQRWRNRTEHTDG